MNEKTTRENRWTNWKSLGAHAGGKADTTPETMLRNTIEQYLTHNREAVNKIVETFKKIYLSICAKKAK